MIYKALASSERLKNILFIMFNSLIKDLDLDFPKYHVIWGVQNKKEFFPQKNHKKQWILTKISKLKKPYLVQIP